MSAPSCFPGRYSPSYRSSEQMRRCMPNPSVSNPELIKKKKKEKQAQYTMINTLCYG